MPNYVCIVGLTKDKKLFGEIICQTSSTEESHKFIEENHSKITECNMPSHIKTEDIKDLFLTNFDVPQVFEGVIWYKDMPMMNRKTQR